MGGIFPASVMSGSVEVILKTKPHHEIMRSNSLVSLQTYIDAAWSLYFFKGLFRNMAIDFSSTVKKSFYL